MIERSFGYHDDVLSSLLLKISPLKVGEMSYN